MQRAIRQDVALFQRIGFDLACQQLPEQVQIGIQIIRVSQVLEGQPLQFVLRAPQHLAEIVVHPDEPAGHRNMRYADIGKIEGPAELFLAFAQAIMLRHETFQSRDFGPQASQFEFSIAVCRTH